MNITQSLVALDEISNPTAQQIQLQALVKYYLSADTKRQIAQIGPSGLPTAELVGETTKGKILIKCCLPGRKITLPQIKKVTRLAKANACRETIIVNLTESAAQFATKLKKIDSPEAVAPITYIDRATLTASAQTINWDDFKSPPALIPEPKKALWPHQQHAVINVLRGFQEETKGKLIMACGAGKTLTCLQIAEKLLTQTPEQAKQLAAPGTLADEAAACACYTQDFAGTGDLTNPCPQVLVLVPSISLLRQTLNAWAAQCARPFNYAVVCSDAKAADLEADQPNVVQDLPRSRRSPKNWPIF